MKSGRDQQFHLLFSEEERDQLMKMAEAHGMSASDLIRYLIGNHLRTVHQPEPLRGKTPVFQESLRRWKAEGNRYKAAMLRWHAEALERNEQ
jgi:hypothetical protein